MSKEQLFFLNMLRDHLNGKATACTADLDWSVLLRIAKSQQLSTVLYHQCKDWLASQPQLTSYYAELGKCYAAQLVHVTDRGRVFSQFTSTLSEQGVQFVLLKGEEIARYYPVPQLRISGDIDLLMSSADRDLAHQLLVSSGFTPSPRYGTEWGYTKGCYHLELHDRLFYPSDFNTKAILELGESCWENLEQVGDTSRYRFCGEYNLVYLLLHLRKHLVFSGVGFRLFFDIAALLQKTASDLDFNKVSKLLEGIDCLQFAKICFTLCGKWFGTPNPLESVELEEEFYIETCAVLFANGVFGFDNLDNQYSAMVNTARGKSVPLKVVKVWLRAIFLNYSELVTIPRYAFLKGKKWLLPVAWVYRAFYKLFCDRGSATKVLAKPVAGADKLKKREDFLTHWGV